MLPVLADGARRLTLSAAPRCTSCRMLIVEARFHNHDWCGSLFRPSGGRSVYSELVLSGERAIRVASHLKA